MTNHNQEAPRSHQDGPGATGRPLARNAIHRSGKTLTNDAAGAPEKPRRKRGRRAAFEICEPDPIPSRAVCDPFVRLAAATLLQSLIDLEDTKSLIKSVDALCFLISDTSSLFLTALDFPDKPELLLKPIDGGFRYGSNKFKRKSKEDSTPKPGAKCGNGGNELETAGPISEDPAD